MFLGAILDPRGCCPLEQYISTSIGSGEQSSIAVVVYTSEVVYESDRLRIEGNLDLEQSSTQGTELYPDRFKR